MSQLKFLNAFLTERLTAVALETSVVFERKIGEYQEEISRSNEENKRLKRLLDLVFNPEIKLHRADSQQLFPSAFEDEEFPERNSLGQGDAAIPEIKEQKEVLLCSFPPAPQQQSLPLSEEEVPLEQSQYVECSPSLGQDDPETTRVKEEEEEHRTCHSEIRVPEPTSLRAVSEATSLRRDPECVGGSGRPILAHSVPEEEVPAEHWWRSLCLKQENTGRHTHIKEEEEELKTCHKEEHFQELESKIRVPQPTSLWKSRSTVANLDTSAGLNEKEWADGMEETLHLSYTTALPVSKEEVPPEMQERGQEDPEGEEVPCVQKNREQDWSPNLGPEVQETTLKIQGLEFDSRGPKPTSFSQLLFVEPPNISAVQSKSRGHVDVDLCRKVSQSLTTLSEDFSHGELDETSDFSNWCDEEFSDTDDSSSESSSSDSSSCNNNKNTQTDSISPHPGERRSSAEGGVNKPSTFSNQPGTELRGEDANTQRDPVEGSPAKRCKRMNGHSPVKKYCLYCGKPCSKFSRHLQCVHGHKPDVSTAFSFRKNSPERKAMLSLLNRKGNVLHEVGVAKDGTGDVVACFRPEVPRPTQDYTHCMQCHGLFLRKSLWLHMKHCPQCPKGYSPKPGKKKRILSTMEFTSRPKPHYVSTGLWKLVCDMTVGEVSLVVKNDQYILHLGEEMFDKLQAREKSVKLLQQRLRNLARLLIAARKCTPLRSFEDFVLPTNLPHIITAVKAVAGYNEENKVYDRPSLAVALGQSLTSIAKTVELCALKAGQQMIAESAGKFQTFKWHEVVMAGALSTLNEPTTRSTKLGACVEPKSTPKAKPFLTETTQTSGRHKWTAVQVAAVEKCMMPFLKSETTPRKKDCVRFLQSEPEALKGRSWSGIKFYIRNRISRNKMVANCLGSSQDIKSNPGQQTNVSL